MSITEREAFELDQAAAQELEAELSQILEVPSTIMADPRAVRVSWSKAFANAGWACSVRVPRSNLTVSYVRGEVGLCVQLGNVARTYADLLKLQLLFNEGLVSSAVVVVPDEDLSKSLGSNHASFDRLAREIALFRSVITIPILLLGVHYRV